MHIKQLSLRNFRNYEEAQLNFNHKINVLIGENAQGKTNFMEAIYVLALARSYRTPRERELILWDQEFAKVEGEVFTRNRLLPLEMVITKKGKKAKLNRIEQRRLSDYVGSLNVVMFAPEDLSLIKGSPSIRRRFINIELGQIQPSYIYHLGQYQKVLQQRNHFLKEMPYQNKADDTMLDVLTEQLIDHAALLLERRFIFLERLQKWAKDIHYQISRQAENLEIVYNPTIDVSEGANKEKIKDIYTKSFQHVKEREIKRGLTLIGPHRDDFTFYINNKDVQKYGSQGQQRTTALSVKLAEIELIHAEIGEYPILLLDDVLSELDHYRQSHLLNAIEGKVQTFVSTTSIEGIDHETLKKAEFFRVESGVIKEE